MRAYVLWFACMIAPLVLNAGEGEIKPVKARGGEAFIDFIGVNVQLGAEKGSYAINPQVIKPRLMELGVRHIRDACGLERKGQIAKLQDLGKAGFHFHLIIKPTDGVSLCKLFPGLVTS